MKRIVEELSEHLDPWEAFQRVATLPNPLFLDSAMRHPRLGRYSYVVADPKVWLTSKRGRIRIEERFPESHLREIWGDPFETLRECLALWSQETLPDLPPFQGGVAGLFGYDLCHHIERLPRPRIEDFPLPDMAVGIYDWVLAFDHERSRTWLITATQGRVRQVRSLLRQPKPTIRHESVPPAPTAPRHRLEEHPDVWSNFDRPSFLRTIARGVEYVHAGDCFQVNLAQRLMTPASCPPLELYGRLRELNAAPYAGYFDTGGRVILSASPELFLEVNGRHVETRPIKGTRPCAYSLRQDASRQRELLTNPKDRAENVMIVDLLRNDLGRVCEYGSVRVPTVCGLETYRYVHHLVSVVEGRLAQGRDALDLLRAAFPGGSITGAPKVRAMEIIAELEPTARGPYCGSLGFLGWDGAMATSILIRTIVGSHGWYWFPVGGGIVAGSVPEAEYRETLDKAEGMLRAFSK